MNLDRNICAFIAIGAAGGEGLSDVKALLSRLNPQIKAAVLVVLRRSPRDMSDLQGALNGNSSMPVVIATGGEQLASGVVYIGEPGAHLSLAPNLFCSLIADPEGADRNSAVDLLFESVARHAGTQGIGIVLSGSRDDGSRGLDAIHNAGGLTMVFTPDDGRPPGMPENAVDYSGLVDVIGDIDTLASVINEALCPQPVGQH